MTIGTYYTPWRGIELLLIFHNLNQPGKISTIFHMIFIIFRALLCIVVKYICSKSVLFLCEVFVVKYINLKCILTFSTIFTPHRAAANDLKQLVWTYYVYHVLHQFLIFRALLCIGIITSIYSVMDELTSPLLPQQHDYSAYIVSTCVPLCVYLCVFTTGHLIV